MAKCTIVTGNILMCNNNCGVNVAVAYLIADRLTRTSPNWSHFDPPTALRPLFPQR